jgi:hypothetical protein
VQTNYVDNLLSTKCLKKLGARKERKITTSTNTRTHRTCHKDDLSEVRFLTVFYEKIRKSKVLILNSDKTTSSVV